MALFSDPDPLEQDMGLPVEDMSPAELASYFRAFQQAINRVDISVDGYPEMRVFSGLQHRYGKTTGAQIIKWALFTHRGRWHGKVITYTAFSKGRKWWTDQMAVELQQHLRKEHSRTAGAPMPKLADL